MDVEVGVVDLKGNYLKKVFRGKLSAGSNRVEWDGKIEHGKPLQPGFYFIFIKDMVETRYFKIIKI
jgi:flagellar hook assembly protein FlgD